MNPIPLRSRAPRRRARTRLRPFAVLALALAACAASAWTASADFLLETRTRLADAGSGAERTGRIWLDDARIRLEFSDSDAPDRIATVIFRGDRGLYWALDPAQRSYVQIDRDEVEQLGERVARARREMTERLADLPPDQRAAVEQMLADMAPAEPAEALERVVPTEVRGLQDALPIRLSRLMLGDALVGEVWTVEWKHVDAGRLDFRAFKKLADFQRDLLFSLGQSAGTAFGGEPFEVFDRLDGYPLRVRRLRDGVMEAETRFSLPRRVDALPGRYEVPEGYERRTGPAGAE
jgi:hypothetical protein